MDEFSELITKANELVIKLEKDIFENGIALEKSQAQKEEKEALAKELTKKIQENNQKITFLKTIKGKNVLWFSLKKAFQIIVKNKMVEAKEDYFKAFGLIFSYVLLMVICWGLLGPFTALMSTLGLFLVIVGIPSLALYFDVKKMKKNHNAETLEANTSDLINELNDIKSFLQELTLKINDLIKQSQLMANEKDQVINDREFIIALRSETMAALVSEDSLHTEFVRHSTQDLKGVLKRLKGKEVK